MIGDARCVELINAMPRAADKDKLWTKITPCPVNYAICQGKNEQ